MQLISEFISSNYGWIQWVFSGIGVFFVGLFLKKQIYSKNKVKQQNIKAGGDVVGRDKITKR